MHVSKFLHVQTRKSSWFAHYWMEEHRQRPFQFPLILGLDEWVRQFTAWEELGCPAPKGKTEWHKELTE
jgi:hypothetical protein